MIANYGYRDGEGEFYITIDTARCAGCVGNPCVAACPKGLFLMEEDPYGEAAAAIDESKRRKLKYECGDCKWGEGASPLPCVTACPFDAVSHSW